MKKKNVDKPYIESRIDDWLKRIDSLYREVERSLSDSNNVTCDTSRKTTMNEEQMQKFNVSSVDVPILDLRRDNELLATFKPVGLWVLGANGRVDILSEKGAYILVDGSDFGDKADWKIYTPNNRKTAEKLSRSFIEQLVK